MSERPPVTRARLALTVAAALALGTAGVADAATRTVTVGSNYYSPSRITVNSGTVVRWSWDGGSTRHDVTVNTGPVRFSSPTQSSGSYTKTLRRAGTYKLYCTQHSSQMRMTLVVR